MSIEGWIPDIGSRLGFLGRGPDEDFRDVYEAYEQFYKAAKTPNGRGRVMGGAAQDFMDEVIEYYDIGEEEYSAGMGWVGLMDTGDINLLEEKMGEDELYRYLEGEL